MLHPVIMENEEVSTAALPTPLMTRNTRHMAVNACALCTSVTSPNDAADAAQISRPVSSSVFRCITLHRATALATSP